MTSTPEQPGGSSGERTGGYGFTPVQGARLPIPGNAEFAVFFLVRRMRFSSRTSKPAL
jgi:hypothetical protein